MKKALAILLSASLVAPVPPLYAQTTPAAQAQPASNASNYTQAELDQMLAPVALYPDELLSQVLMAATYPLEIIKAARWSSAHPGLKGDDAVRAAANEDWDPSVKSLVAFPDLLARMSDKIDWTQQLGDAFLGQETQVMNTVQTLRHRAEAAGTLRSDERQRVTEDGGNIAIAPSNPQVVYVPYYDPLVVYGSWWWPAYPPVVWAPWPGYVVVHPGFWWGVGIGITAGFFFGSVSWSAHHVTVVRTNVYYARPPVVVHRYSVAHRPLAVGPWQHDPSHRHGVDYRTPQVRQRYAHAAPVRPAPVHRASPSGPRMEQRDGGHGGGRDDRRGSLMPPPMRASAAGHAEAQRRVEPRAGFNPPRPASAREMPQPRFGAVPDRGGDRPGSGWGGGERGGEGGHGGGGFGGERNGHRG